MGCLLPHARAKTAAVAPAAAAGGRDGTTPPAGLAFQDYDWSTLERALPGHAMYATVILLFFAFKN